MVIKARVLFYSVIFRYDKSQLRHCEVTNVSRPEVTGPTNQAHTPHWALDFKKRQVCKGQRKDTDIL